MILKLFCRRQNLAQSYASVVGRHPLMPIGFKTFSAEP
jgi:hypothetical protein